MPEDAHAAHAVDDTTVLADAGGLLKWLASGGHRCPPEANLLPRLFIDCYLYASRNNLQETIFSPLLAH